MRRLLERCAALDVHKKQVTVCVRLVAPGGEIEELMAEFSTMASQLLAVRHWLKGLGCDACDDGGHRRGLERDVLALEDEFEGTSRAASTPKDSPNGSSPNSHDSGTT